MHFVLFTNAPAATRWPPPSYGGHVQLPCTPPCTKKCSALHAALHKNGGVSRTMQERQKRSGRPRAETQTGQEENLLAGSNRAGRTSSVPGSVTTRPGPGR